MKAIYLNPYPYISPLQIHSNTNELGFGVYNPDQGLDFPLYRLSTYDKPGENGAVFSNALYGGRSIVLQGRVSASTIAQFETNRRALQSALRVIKDSNSVTQPILLQFTTMDDLSLQCYVFPNRQPTFERKSLTHSAFYLDLFAPDMNLYSQSQTISSVSIPSGGGVTYPVIYPVVYGAQVGGSIVVNNSGNTDSYPTLTFNGPLTSPFLLNLTTNEVFKINLTLGSGDILVCDMAQKTMVLNGSTNAMQYFDPNNTWMRIIPGNNTLKLGSSLSSDTGNTQVGFRNAYVGV